MKMSTKYTSLAVAGLFAASLGTLAFTNKVQAATDKGNDKATTTQKAKSPIDIAKDNVASAQKTVDDAQKKYDAAADNEKQVIKENTPAVKAYDVQAQKVGEAQKNVTDKQKALANATNDYNAAKDVASKATPDNIAKVKDEIAKQAQAEKQVRQEQDELNKKTENASKAKDAADAAITSSQKELNDKQAAATKADQDVKSAEAALNGSGADIINKNIDITKENIKNIESTINKNKDGLKKSEDALKSNQDKIVDTNDKIKAVSKQVEEAKAQLETAQKALDKAKQDLADKQAEIEANKKNGALGFFESIFNDTKNSEALRNSAKEAIQLIKGEINSPLEIDGERVSTTDIVEIGEKGDATSLEMMQAIAPYYEKLNEFRKNHNRREIGVDLRDVAQAMVSADAQKVADGGHIDYPMDNVAPESISTYDDPIQSWADEENTWKELVAQHPDYAKYDRDFNNVVQFSLAHFNEYQEVGHYLNMLVADHFGLAKQNEYSMLEQYNSQNPAVLKVADYVQLVNHYINNIDQTEAVNALQKKVDTAQSELDQVSANKKKTEKNLSDLQTSLVALNKAVDNCNNSINDFNNTIKSQKDKQAKQEKQLSDYQKQLQDLNASQPEKIQKLNDAKEAQTKAHQAVQNAATELATAKQKATDAQKALEAAQKALEDHGSKVKAAIQKSIDLNDKLNELNSAQATLTQASQAKDAANNDLVNAKSNLDTQKTILNSLQDAKDKAAQKIDNANKKTLDAKAALDKSKSKLAEAKNALYNLEHPYIPSTDDEDTTTNTTTPSTTPEEAMSGVAHVPAPSDMPDAQVELFDGQGKGTGNYIPTNSNWKVFAKKTINGKLYYRLGTDSQWINADAVSTITPAENSKPAINSEEAVSGIAYVPVINGRRNWKVQLLDQNGNYTGNYISTNSNWKVFAKKTINGKTYYRIGNQNQWIPAQYMSLSSDSTTTSEKKISGIAHVPVINGNRNWKVALLDSNGHYTGKYIPTHSNWKVFATKTVNGTPLVRIGTQNQWIPMDYISLMS